MTHDSHFLTFMKRFTFKSVFSWTICSRRNVPLYFFYKVQKIGYQKHDNNRHRNGGCSACDHTEVFMAVESLGKCLHALQVAFSDYSRNHCRLISRLVIKKTYPWYAGLRSINGYTVAFRSKILVLISNSGNDVIHQVKQRQWVFPEKKWVYVNGGTCPEPPEPPGTNRNPPEPPGTLKKAQMIKLKKTTNNKK